MNYDRANAILYNDSFRKYLKRIEEAEKERIFCLHNMQHFMDVARIAYILNLENNLNYSKDIIYGTALLHDIGRWLQYEEGIPHERASAELAGGILRDCGYNEDEIIDMVKAIALHRSGCEDKNSLSYIMYFSDKASRACYNCKASKECNWSEEKKNIFIKY